MEKQGEEKRYLKDLKHLTITSEHKYTLDALSGQFSGPQMTMGNFPSQKAKKGTREIFIPKMMQIVTRSLTVTPEHSLSSK